MKQGGGATIDQAEEREGAVPCESAPPARRWYRKRRFWIPCLVLAVLVGFVVRSSYEPAEIPLRADRVWGLDCLRAPKLVIQGLDAQGNVWATRGLWAYRRGKEERRFVRQFHVPTGLSRYWLMNLAVIRRLTGREECVELLILRNGAVCAVAGGHMWYRPKGESGFRKTLTLPHYGMGVGRGIFGPGLAELQDGTVVFGEYFRNDQRTGVRLYAGKDGGKNWKIAHEFPPGKIRHVHAVQQDPFTGKCWVCTGDEDAEPMIAWSADGCKTLHPIGSGNQMWRACQLVFTEGAILWGSDTGSPSLRGIYRWDRHAREAAKLATVDAHIMFATGLADGTIVMSTDVEAFEGTGDEKTKLWIVIDGKVAGSTACGARTAYEGSAYARFAYLRLSRTQGAEDLFLTGHNVDGCDGDLLVIASKTLRSAAAVTSRPPSRTKPAGTRSADG